MKLGLDPFALAERQTGIYGTDAKRIIDGDWKALWREKMGLSEGEDLSNILRVQLGSFTEPFNLAWCEKQEGRLIDYFTSSDWQAAAWRELTGRPAQRDGRRRHPDIPYMAANLDAISTTRRGARMYLDAKHVGKADETTVIRYTPQMTHCALVLSWEWWGISFIIGNGRWDYIEQEVDPFFAEELLVKEEMFWSYVKSGDEPPDMTPVVPPKPTKMLRTVDLGDEHRAQWPNWAGQVIHFMFDFASTKAAADKHFIAREAIKKLIPDDVGEVRRGEFTIQRNKADALVFSPPKETK